MDAAAPITAVEPAPAAGPDGPARPLSAGPGPGPEWGTRLRDFITDGSVAALCDELSLLLDIPIWLRDRSGEVIVPEAVPGADAGGGAGRQRWAVVSEAAGRSRAHARLGILECPCPADARLERETSMVELRIGAHVIGAIAYRLPCDIDRSRMAHVRRSLALLGSSVCDACESQIHLNNRVRELDALFRLSSMLSGAADPNQVLNLALDLAMQVLRADAGSIAVIEDGPGAPDGRGPVIRFRRALSEKWIAATTPLSRGGLLRQAAMAGQIIAVENLRTDDRIADQQRVIDEGLCSLLTTGLLDPASKPIGLIRLYTRSPRVFTEDEGELLKAISEHAASAVTSARLRALREQDQHMQRQVRLAASVQRRMLPRTMPSIRPFEVAAHYAPSFDLGGDFYDFLELGGHLGVLIGDVVGKGVPAALLMSAVRASLRAHAQDVYHIDEVLSRVNRSLARDTLDNEFATVWYGVADPSTLRLTYCGAGHDWPLLVRVPRDRPVEDRDLSRLTADGMALGIDESQKYPKGTAQLAPRDVLLAFTDGLHDATNFEGKRFGGTRLRNALLEVLRAEPEASASRIVDHVVAQVRQHTGLSGRSDDLTVVVLRVGEKK
ncbi:MAG: SpoIIE family protein phosphatase [Phycisphaerales bacterium]|nr:SpoIIE family protein phosphatase [Phycisphaerales bacterium]